MPSRRSRTIALALGALLAVATACSDGDDDDADGTPSPTVVEGPVAATAVAPGDCLNGIVLGAAEQAEITSAEAVSCERAHTLEVFATFTLRPGDFELADPAEYPGRAPVVRAADAGCMTRIGDLVDDPSVYGLLALWPSQASWAAGDRTVACAVFAPDGAAYVGRQL